MVAFRNSDNSGRTSGLLLRCVLYSLLSLGLIIFDKRYDNVSHLRRLLSMAAYPVQVAVASPFEGWDWFRENVSSRESLRADEAKLEAELRLADFRLQRYEALEAEIQRLRGLRANTADVTDRFVVGDIMDLDLDAFRERVLVDKGARDGVYVGQAVLDAGGVFGQVARVEQLTSEVILISDAAHALPVQVNRNGLRTIAVGTGDVSRLKLPYLSTSADVVAGDLLVTSGLGGGFPAGYPVGTVAEVKRDPAQSLAEIEVRPAAALDRSRELLFVWLKPGAPPPMAASTSASTMGQTPVALPAKMASPAKPAADSTPKPLTDSAVKHAADPAVKSAQSTPSVQSGHAAPTEAAHAATANAQGSKGAAAKSAPAAGSHAGAHATPAVKSPAAPHKTPSNAAPNPGASRQ